MKIHAIKICGCIESCTWQFINICIDTYERGKSQINNLNFNIRKLEKPRRKEIKLEQKSMNENNRKVIEKYNNT